jgi:hypothetical protein
MVDMKKARLTTPYRGYSIVELITKNGYKWLVRTESGLEFEIYEDEFELI